MVSQSYALLSKVQGIAAQININMLAARLSCFSSFTQAMPCFFPQAAFGNYTRAFRKSARQYWAQYSGQSARA